MKDMDEIASKVKSGQMFKGQMFNIIMYFSVVVFIVFVYHFISDGDFSFLLTLGSVIRLFGFIMLLVRLMKDKNANGLSLKTQILYAVVFLARSFSIFLYEGYKPYDRSGDWFYQAIELLSFFMATGIIAATILMFKSTYNADEDSFGSTNYLPHHFAPVYLAVPCLILAMLIHPSLNKNFLTDVSWTFAMYLETVAVLPQLYMFQKVFQKMKQVDSWTSHFVFALGFSRFLHLAFWASSHHELNDRGSSSVTGGWVGYFILANNLIHALIMVDYCYYYLKSAKDNTPLSLPGTQV